MKKTTITKTLALILAATPLFASADMLTRQLQLGMRGSDVGTLQSFLAQDQTVYPQGLVTGYFGFLTKSAVSNFQSKNGISTVGRVGPQTLGVINAQMAGGYSNSTVRAITDISVNASNNQVTMAWNTAEGSSAWVYYSTSPISISEATDYSPLTISAANVTANTDLRTSHSVTMTGLSSNTTYYYVLYVKNSAGTESITLPQTFRTSN
jgi:peptidoglycan hydrolase-like protein with peptidoglycan-binding domain